MVGLRQVFLGCKGDEGWATLVWGCGSPGQRGRGCLWQQRGCCCCWFSCHWHLQSQRGTQPSHNALLCHSSGKRSSFLQGHWPKDMETRAVGLSWSYRQLKDPHGHGQRELHTTHLPCVQLLCVQPPWQHVRENWNYFAKNTNPKLHQHCL